MNTEFRPSQRRGWVFAALVGSLLLCVMAYLPALDGEFLFDDQALLRTYDCWHGIDKIPAMFGFGEPNPCTYRPVRYVTYAIDWEIGGVNPLVIHISNLVYHLLAAIAVYFVCRRWASPASSVLVMALWALHPVNTDAVAYMSGRRDVVSTLLFLLALLQLMPPKDKRLTVVRVLLGALLFYLAIRAKEMAVTLPVVLVCAGLASHAGKWSDLKAHFKRRAALYVALVGGAVAFVVFRAILDPHSHMQDRWWGGSPVSNFATVFSLYVRYLWLVLWPARLIGDYHSHTIRGIENFADPLAILGIALYVAMLALIVISLWRGWRATAFGIGWFLITMLPVSHIFPHHELFAEHYLYLPMIGLLIAALPAVDRLLASSTLRIRVVALVCSLAVLSAYAARTADRAADFQTGLSFYSAAYEQAPYNVRIIYNLGLSLLEIDDCERAVPLLLQASRRIRRNQPLSRGKLIQFLNCSERVGRADVVDTLLRELLRRYPMDPLGLAWHGRRLLEHGRYEEAAIDLGAAVNIIRGRDPNVVAMLAMALNLDERPEEALDVLARYPADHKGHCEQHVRALLNLGIERYTEAFERVQECLQRYPRSLLLLEYRAALFLAAGRRDLAARDIARLERLGASVEVLERLRSQ